MGKFEAREPSRIISSLLKALYNRAISQKLISAEYYPFGKNKVKLKLTQSLKIPLSKDDIRKLEEVQEKDVSAGKWHARNMFLFSYYNAGMRSKDVICLLREAVIDGMLPYRMSKNEKPQYLRLHPKAVQIVEHYREKYPDDKYLFPYMDLRPIKDEFDRERRIKSINRTIGNRLKGLADDLGINKKVFMHIARHTFANHSGNKIPIQLLQVLYRHSSINTTVDYQRQFIQDELEDALSKVVD